jgi:hypothetical protein
VPGDAPIAWPERDKASRAGRDYLSALDRASTEAPPTGRKRKPRMAISLTDPEAVRVAYRKMPSIFADHANYLIDNKLGIIVDAEGNRANRIDEPARDRVRALAKTPAFKRSRNQRKKVEMAFAHMKRIFKLDRLRLRGLSGARDEVLLTATVTS